MFRYSKNIIAESISTTSHLEVIEDQEHIDFLKDQFSRERDLDNKLDLDDWMIDKNGKYYVFAHDPCKGHSAWQETNFELYHPVSLDKEGKNREFYRTLAKKTDTRGNEFVLQLQAVMEVVYIEDEEFNQIPIGEVVSGYDYIIAGPNWLSGFLKAQGYDEKRIWEYWDSVTIQDANDAWEAHYERGRC